MPQIEAIVAIDEECGMAKDGKIPWKNEEDMKFFREKTIGNIIIMGSKTLLSLPNKAPLKNRFNIVLTNNKQDFLEKYSSYNNIIFYNYDEVMDFINNNETNKTIYVIGGKQIYDLLIPICDRIWISVIPGNYNCDIKLDIDVMKYDVSIHQNADVNAHTSFNLYCLTKIFYKK